MIGPTDGRSAATLPIAIIKDPALVALQAVVNPDGDRDGPLADQFLQIGIGHSLIGLETSSFEDHVRGLVVPALVLLVIVGVLVRSGQALLLHVIKGELAAAT